MKVVILMGYNKNKRVIVKCHFCEKEFDVQPYRLKNTERLFCSKSCQSEWQTTDEYKEIHKNRKKRKGIKVICVYCKKDFTKRPQNVNKTGNDFCGASCRNLYNTEKIQRDMTKDKVMVYCKNCGKEKYVIESVFKKNKFHFCDKYCYYTWNMTQNEVFNTTSKPQVILNKLLDDMSIKYENEILYDYYFLDNTLFINNRKYLIECNGTFWHTDNREYQEVKYERQREGVVRDHKKNRYIKEKFNLNILYLWEIDIENNIEICKKLISEYISKDGNLNDYHSFNYELDKNNNIKLKKDIIIPYMYWNNEDLEKITNIK